MSSNFMVYRIAARQLEAQGQLHRRWQRSATGDGCGLRVLMDIAGFTRLDISATSALQNPALRLILTQLHQHLLDTSQTYMNAWEELLKKKSAGRRKRKRGLLSKKARRTVLKRHVPITYTLLRTAFVTWHDSWATHEEVVIAMHGLASKLEEQHRHEQQATRLRVMQARPLWVRQADALDTEAEHEPELITN